MTAIGARAVAAATALKPLGLSLLVSKDGFVITDKPDSLPETGVHYPTIEQVEAFIADHRPTGAARPAPPAGPRREHTAEVVLYARFIHSEIARTVEAPDGALVDVDAEGRVLGVEVIGGTDWAGALASLAMVGRLKVVTAEKAPDPVAE